MASPALAQLLEDSQMAAAEAVAKKAHAGAEAEGSTKTPRMQYCSLEELNEIIVMQSKQIGDTMSAIQQLANAMVAQKPVEPRGFPAVGQRDDDDDIAMTQPA